MLWYVAFVAVVNLALGFALAIGLARSRLLGAGSPLGLSVAAAPATSAFWQLRLWRLRAGKYGSWRELLRQVLKAAREKLRPTTPPVIETAHVLTPPRADCQPSPTMAAADSPTEEAAPALAANVDEFLSGSAEFRQQLSQLDADVRQCARNPEGREVERCVQAFQAANQQYLAQTEQTTQKLEEHQDQFGELSETSLRVQQALADQAEQVADAHRCLAELDAQGQPEESCRQLLDHADALSQSSQQLCDQLQIVQEELAQAHERIAALDPRLACDALTQLASRAQFDADCDEYWADEAARDRPAALALVDVDGCEQINAVKGQDLGDQVIRGVAQILAAAVPHGAKVARFSGQQFSVLLPDSAPQVAVGCLELVRQVVEGTRFVHQGQRIPVTVSCAVVTADAAEAPAAALARAENTLQAAKDHGRNCTLLLEGDVPGHVSPPQLAIASQTYEL